MNIEYLVKAATFQTEPRIGDLKQPFLIGS